MTNNSHNTYQFGEGKPGNPTVAYTSSVQLRDIQKKHPLRVLSERDWEQWIQFGYVIIPNAIPDEYVQQTTDFLWEFQEMDRNEPSTWDREQLRTNEMADLNNSGMVEAYHHQTLWNNRQHPKVYGAFADIWDTPELWVTFDRANLNTPNKDNRPFEGFIHWDIDTTQDPIPINVQGVLSLVDTSPELGGTYIVPQLFHKFDQWKATQPADRDPWKPDLTGFDPMLVQMKAGDLLIFNSLMAHGICPNRSDQVRLAQYISMTPADEGDTALRSMRVESWESRTSPQGYAFPGDPRQWEQNRYPRPELTDLGQQLLGSKSWKD